MRRTVLLAIAVAITLLWAVAPYGKDRDGVTYATFGSMAVSGVIDLPHLFAPSSSSIEERVQLLILLISLFVPMYPVFLALKLAISPRLHKRWEWMIVGVVVLLLCPVSWFSADLWLSFIGMGFGVTSTPTLYPLIWLLPGLAGVAGVVAIVIGIAPRGRIARIVFGNSAPT